jgi:hypothetical protein
VGPPPTYSQKTRALVCSLSIDRQVVELVDQLLDVFWLEGVDVGPDGASHGRWTARRINVRTRL